MLRELFKRPDQAVTAVATRLKVTIPLANRYLRELNARGLLKASRVSGWVQYRPCADPLVPQSSALLKALRETMDMRADAVEFIFRNATAWTHPRRGLILHALRDEPLGLSELGRRTGISKPALIRHLRKLNARGLLVATDGGEHALARPPSPLAAVLLRLALMSACESARGRGAEALGADVSRWLVQYPVRRAVSNRSLQRQTPRPVDAAQGRGGVLAMPAADLHGEEN